MCVSLKWLGNTILFDYYIPSEGPQWMLYNFKLVQRPHIMHSDYKPNFGLNDIVSRQASVKPVARGLFVRVSL